LKLLDTLYNTLIKSTGSISIDDFHDTVLGIKEKTEDSLSLIASIITMDGRFLFDGDKIILKFLETNKFKKKTTSIKRLSASSMEICGLALEEFRQTHLLDANYVVFDFETTGLSSKYNRVIEIGAIKISKGKIVDKFHSFVDPESYIPKQITDLTGITTEMLENAPDASVAFSNFYEFIADSIIVAHNLSFDYKFLKFNLDKIGLPIPHTGLCTMKLARRFLKENNLISAKLHSVAEYFKIEIEKEHRAFEDAQTTSKIFLHFLELAERNSIDTVHKLYEYQNLSIYEV